MIPIVVQSRLIARHINVQKMLKIIKVNVPPISLPVMMRIAVLMTSW
jgi:hypothetical protein